MKTKPIKTFAEAQKFLMNLPKTGGVVFRAGFGLARARHLFELLGNPEEAYPSIHIAGTSGKGSTAYITEALLRAANKKTGLLLSPHVSDVRERMLINGEFIGEKEFCELADSVAKCLPAMEATELGGPTYFEATTAMAFLAFQKHNVDYAVIETGLGGTYDATNLINRADKLAVVGQIGLDHTAILGDTLVAIAEQKAGIIQRGNQAIALSQDPSVNEVFEARAYEISAKLELFVPGKTVQHIHLSDRGTVFNLKLKPWIWRELRLGAIGRHQAINAGLALKAVQTVALRDGFELGEADARHTLSDLRIPARFEVRAAGKKTIIVDGAHNPQKMQSVVEAVKTLYPNRHVSTLIAMKENKDVPATLRELKSISHDYIVTSFFSKEQDFVNLSADPETLAATISTLGGTATIVKDSHQAFTAALAQTQDILLVTGSFYFIGEIYKELPN